MENSSEQMVKKTENEGNKEVEVRLPVKTSPYVQYNTLEDYKRQGYGAEGHKPVKPNQGGGGTDAPTVSGHGLPQGTKPVL
ncbi:conserved hypothetical protein [Ricinus communis]|uniref:Uncharacterized protein n=1 Tax=Ricinus communis TaxID=3988 RepID=B9RX69_RICCO|nr:conserved hypothetical protein [Ricinus communis]